MKHSLPLLILCCGLLTSCGNTKTFTDVVNKVETGINDAIESIKGIPATVSKSTDTKGVNCFTLSDIDAKTLTKDEKKQLDALAREIKAKDKYYVTVIGHSDNVGNADVNQSVSVQRARLVADYLKKKGVNNITSQGRSYNYPIAGNDTAAGRAKNRRVEVYVSTIGKFIPYE